MKCLPVILAIISVSSLANDSEYERVQDEIFWPKLYNQKYHTLSCAISKEAGQKVAVEHVYPAHWIAQANGCENRENCNTEAYKQASSDLHNLWPALSRYNNSRGKLPFIEIPGEVMRFPEDKCDFERRADGVEPRDYSNGEIARSFLYMIWKYNLPDHGLKPLVIKWTNKFPNSIEEQWRNIVIKIIQGNSNPFINDKNIF
ncbi:endonuclease [Thalassomonas haliotis]|uniref:Endonuclease n=1 Tax=Thalassomonas haliotis TaxID=485448 RepID=A0ABY7VLL4_9GAMM|nr:endonuclease [Thalassomonas haliotis]WDE13572.1 endonuclease [Thalassomonas haliotis]